MADVGVLNLTIQDNSEQAVQGLGRLVDALKSVSQVVGSELKLSSAANQIKRIAKVVSESLNDEVITRLSQFSDAMSKLNGLGNVNINVRGADKIARALDSIETSQQQMNAVGQAAEDMAGRIDSGFASAEQHISAIADAYREMHDSMQAAGSASAPRLFDALPDATGVNENLREYLEMLREVYGYSTKPVGRGTWEDIASGINQATESAQSFYHTMERTNEIVQNMAWGAGSMADKFKEAFNAWSDLRSSFSLGAGQMAGFLGDGSQTSETGWTQYNPWGMSSETGWTVWKDGAIEVEGTVSDAMETIRLEAGQTIPLLTGMSDEAAKVGDSFTQSQFVTGEAAQLLTQRIAVAREAFANAKDHVKDFVASLIGVDKSVIWGPEATANVNAFGNAVKGTAGSVQTLQDNLKRDYGSQMVDNLVNGSSKIELMTDKMNGMKQALAEDINANRVDTQTIAERAMRIQDLANKIEELKQKQEEVSQSTEKVGSAFDDVKNGIKQMFPGLSGLLKRFGSLVKYRMLRSILRHITQGFTEGVKNVYEYSKVVGTSFAPAMDSAVSTLAQFKNSIGAAAAPLISALIPLLNQVVSAVIEAVNWLNQLFALLRGQSTWTRALPQATEAFNKQAKAAGGAGKAMKDLLADWDELNIIQSESGGGGGGGGGTTAAEYANMFEEVSEFSQSVKDVLQFIDDHMGGILGLAKEIGAVLLGWKLSSSFTGILGQLGQLIAGGALIVIGLQLSYGAGFEAGKKGFFSTNDIYTAIGGVIASAVGGSLLTHAFGFGFVPGIIIGATASIVMTLVGYIQGLEDFKDNAKWGDKHLSDEEIDEIIRQQFTFDVDAEIEIFKAHIKDNNEAERNVREAIREFEMSLDNATTIMADVGITDYEVKINAVKNAAEEAQNAVRALNKLIDANEGSMEYTLTNFRVIDANGEDISGDILSNIKIADTTIRDYFTNMGKDIADIILEGERTGWANGEAEQALALMESQRRILRRAEDLKSQMLTETDITSGLVGVVDRDSAEREWNRQAEILKEEEQKAKESITQNIDETLWNAALAESAAIEEEAKGNTKAAERLHKAAQDYKDSAMYMSENIDAMVEERLAPTRELMGKEWAKTLKRVYGEDFTTQFMKVLDEGDLFSGQPGIGLFDSVRLNKENYEKFGPLKANDLLKKAITKEFANNPIPHSAINLPNGSLMVKDVIALTGGLYDVLPEEALDYAMEKFYNATGDYNLAERLFQTVFSVDEDTAKKYSEPFRRKFESEVTSVIIPYASSFKTLFKTLAEGRKGIFSVFNNEEDIDITDLIGTDVPDMKVDVVPNDGYNIFYEFGNKAGEAFMDGFYDESDYADIVMDMTRELQDAIETINPDMDFDEDQIGGATLMPNENNGFAGSAGGTVNEGELAVAIADKLSPLFGNQTNAQDMTNMLLRQLLMKEFKAVVMPSAQNGFANLASQAMMELVNGVGR